MIVSRIFFVDASGACCVEIDDRVDGDGLLVLVHHRDLRLPVRTQPLDVAASCASARAARVSRCASRIGMGMSSLVSSVA